MTHLRIEQNNGIIEEVSSAVIDKLYDIVHSGTLDNTSNLIGRLHTSATYQDYIDYLEDTFKVNGVKLLIIDATKKYMSFADPEVLRILSTTYGDGTGVIISDLESVNRIGNTFVGNTNITTFNEFKYFTGINYSNYVWGENWFNGCTNLREITIPKNVKNFICNEGAFKNCTSLLTVTFEPGSSLEIISGFENCSSLTSISIPDSVLHSSGSCFKNTGLTSFDANNLTDIAGLMFAGTPITTVNLRNVTRIYSWAFENCTSLTSVTFNSNLLSEIDSGAFSGCSNLVINDLSLPNLTVLEGGTFRSTKVKLISNLGSITSIISETFRNCSQLTSVTLPSTVTSIGDRGFKDCTALTTINLDNVTSLGEEVFSGDTSLTTIDLSNVTSLSGSVFNGCSALTTVTGINNITSLGESAFRGCSSLGTGQTLELNLSNQTNYPTMAFASTKYSRLILHSQQQSHSYDARWPLYAYMNDLTYLDLSDWRPGTIGNSLYLDCSFYGNDALVTYIAPITTNYISKIISDLGNRNNFRYLILLATTPPTIETGDSNNQPARWFHQKGGHVDIYVPDSAKAAYLADADWSTIGGYNGSDTITDRLHGLSELPNGVWTTGLASLYLTAALLATS